MSESFRLRPHAGWRIKLSSLKRVMTLDLRDSNPDRRVCAGPRSAHLPRRTALRRRASALVATVALLVTLLGFAACSRRRMPGVDLPLTKLSSDFAPLRAEFNHDAGKVRVLLLLDPT